MDQRISLITLAVADLQASRRFYLDGLGWEAAVDVPGEVLMIKTGDRLLLSLWNQAAFEAEVGPITRGGLAPITLAHNVRTEQGVDRVLEQAGVAGAEVVSPGTKREWGGYSGYFADPDGYRWEVACAPGVVGDIVCG